MTSSGWPLDSLPLSRSLCLSIILFLRLARGINSSSTVIFSFAICTTNGDHALSLENPSSLKVAQVFTGVGIGAGRPIYVGDSSSSITPVSHRRCTCVVFVMDLRRFLEARNGQRSIQSRRVWFVDLLLAVNFLGKVYERVACIWIAWFPSVRLLCSSVGLPVLNFYRLFRGFLWNSTLFQWRKCCSLYWYW